MAKCRFFGVPFFSRICCCQRPLNAGARALAVVSGQAFRQAPALNTSDKNRLQYVRAADLNLPDILLRIPRARPIFPMGRRKGMGTGTVTSAGVIFGPNTSGKRYISLYIHRQTSVTRDKSMWSNSVPPPDEYGIFCTADAGNWRDVQGHYWGRLLVRGSIIVIGLSGERICKFPQNANARDPWHGYPVSPKQRGDDDSPPDAFVDRWIASGVITRTFGRRIQRRKV